MNGRQVPPAPPPPQQQQQQQQQAVKNLFSRGIPQPPLFNRSRSPTNSSGGYPNHKTSGNLVSTGTIYGEIDQEPILRS
jgi:hypothetical protein